MPKNWNIEMIKNWPEVPQRWPMEIEVENEKTQEKLETASKDLGYEGRREKIYEKALEESAKEGEPIIQKANEWEEAFHDNRREASENMKAESAKYRFKNPAFFGRTDSEIAKVQKDKTISDARAEDPTLMGEGSTEAYKRWRANAQERGEIDDSKRIDISSEFHWFEWGEIKWKPAYEDPGNLTTAIGDKKMLEEVRMDALAKNTKINQVPEVPKKGVKENVESNPTLAWNQ